MIDTERAEVDLKTTVNRMRYYIRKLNEEKGEKHLRLSNLFQYDLGVIAQEAKDAHKEQRYGINIHE